MAATKFSRAWARVMNDMRAASLVQCLVESRL
jgi:hypothetical protein